MPAPPSAGPLHDRTTPPATVCDCVAAKPVGAYGARFTGEVQLLEPTAFTERTSKVQVTRPAGQVVVALEFVVDWMGALAPDASAAEHLPGHVPVGGAHCRHSYRSIGRPPRLVGAPHETVTE